MNINPRPPLRINPRKVHARCDYCRTGRAAAGSILNHQVCIDCIKFLKEDDRLLKILMTLIQERCETR